MFRTRSPGGYGAGILLYGNGSRARARTHRVRHQPVEVGMDPKQIDVIHDPVTRDYVGPGSAMRAIHAQLAAGRWAELSFAGQMGNIGSEISRTIGPHSCRPVECRDYEMRKTREKADSRTLRARSSRYPLSRPFACFAVSPLPGQRTPLREKNGKTWRIG